jgi:hypothetical protein
LLRAALLIAAGCATVALAACGDGEPEPYKPPPRVRVEITEPRDRAIVRGANVDVRGAVSPPTADVLGRPARVLDGMFTVVVPLEPGANVVDIAVTAPGRSPSLRAIRVTREQRVVVPDLDGLQLDEVEELLASLGLRVESESGGGLLDPLVPRRPRVCGQEPEPGSRARRGATVRVVVARLC